MSSENEITLTTGPSRERLIEAAEVLFAEKGLSSVSLREINRAAESRNATAIQYHFKNRDGLIQAVLARHVESISNEQHELLDAFEADPSGGIRTLASALVRPLAARLETQSGRNFLQVYAAALTQPDPITITAGPGGSGIERWRQLVNPLLDQEAVILHRRFATITYTVTELGRRARVDRTSHDLFTSMLIDSAAAVLSSPTSQETREILDARTKTRSEKAKAAASDG